MANSTLRQELFSPGHGSFWKPFQYYNRRFDRVYDLKDKCFVNGGQQLESPSPNWRVSRVSSWIRARCRGVARGLQSCTSLGGFDPFLDLHSTGATGGLFPVLHEDAFGISGVRGLDQWIFDSGATSSCSNDLSHFTNMSKDVPFKRIRVANNSFATIEGIGDVDIRIRDQKSGTSLVLRLKGVLYIPAVPVNLISTRALFTDSGVKSVFGDDCTLLYPDGSSVAFSSRADSRSHYYCVANGYGKNGASLFNFARDDASPELFDPKRLSTRRTHVSADTVHARLGHCGSSRAHEAMGGSLGLPQVPNYKKHITKVCPACKTGGARKHPFHSIPEHAKPTVFGDMVQSDLCGPFPVSITGGYEYILCFVDVATGHAEIYLLRSKHSSEVISYFHRYLKKWKHKLPNGTVKEWKTDNGGEFISGDLHDFCDEFAVKRSFTIPFCSPQNGVAERLWGTMQRCMRILLAASGVPISFWHYAAMQAIFLHNNLPRHSNVGHISPHEALTGNKPDFSNIRVWGCIAYCTVRNDGDIDTRVSPTGVRAVHLGRDPKRNGWIVYIPSLNRITSSRDISFDEEHFLRFDAKGNVVDDLSQFVEESAPMDPVRVYNDTTRQAPWRNEWGSPLPSPAAPVDQPQLAPSPAAPIPAAPNVGPNTGGPQRASSRWNSNNTFDFATPYEKMQCTRPNCTIPSKNGYHDGPHSYEQLSARSRQRGAHFVFEDPDSVFFNFALAIDSDEQTDGSDSQWSIATDRFGRIPVPSNYTEAMASRFAHKWKEAMDREIQELLGRKTWDPIDLPAKRKNTKSKWVYTVKYKSDGSIDRFKARFVVCGYSQVHGIDYENSFSSTMRASTFRMLVALAAQRNLTAEHLDISNAFCQADLNDVDIWVEPPKGYPTLCGSGQGLKLKKALYGTKQASYLWQQTLCKFLRSVGFTRCRTDPCVYTKTVGKHQIIIGCYVDDILVLHDPKSKLFQQFLSQFLQSRGGQFDGKHLGKLDWFLGIKVDRYANGDYTLNQSKYIKDLLDRFVPNSDTIAFARRVPYPPEKFKLLAEAKTDEEIERVKLLPYLQLVGALLYLATMSRPDLLFHMSVLCSFMQNPSEQCYEAAQSLLLYAGKTRGLSLHYSSDYKIPEDLASQSDAIRKCHGIYAYSDSTWTAPKSTCGYVVFMAGGPVAFSSRKLNIIADSSALAEYSAGSACSKELTYVRNLQTELGNLLDGPIVMGVDNTACIKISNEPGAGKLTKHFDFAQFRLRDEVEHLRLVTMWVSTDHQTADVFTKALDEKTFLYHRGKLMH